MRHGTPNTAPIVTPHLHDMTVILHIWNVIKFNTLKTQKSPYARPVPSQSSTCLHPRTIQLWPPTYLCEWTQHVHCDSHQQLKLFHISVPVTTLQLFNTTYHYHQCFLQLCMALQCISATKNRYFHIWVLCHVTDFHFIMRSLTQTSHAILVHSRTYATACGKFTSTHHTLWIVYTLLAALPNFDPKKSWIWPMAWCWYESSSQNTLQTNTIPCFTQMRYTKHSSVIK